MKNTVSIAYHCFYGTHISDFSLFFTIFVSVVLYLFDTSFLITSSTYTFYDDPELNRKKPHNFNDNSKKGQDKSLIEGFI